MNSDDSNPLSLAGQTAIITGGAMGIGLAITDRFHRAGANVVIADPSPTRISAIDSLEPFDPETTLALDIDIAKDSSAEEMVAETVAKFGRLDILVNNAGIFPQQQLIELERQFMQRILDVNLTGLTFACQAAARQMIDQGDGGKIINITSIDALHPSAVGLASYDASKHGVWGLTKNIALELAEYEIQVNAIAPGAIDTPGVGLSDDDARSQFAQMIPMGRFGDPAEVANVALFLASPLSSYMTGSQIVVDGGRLLR